MPLSWPRYLSIIILDLLRWPACLGFGIHSTSLIPYNKFLWFRRTPVKDFPGGPVVKNPSSNAGDMGLIPGQRTKGMGQLS